MRGSGEAVSDAALPFGGVTVAMKAGEHHDGVRLNPEVQTIGEVVNNRPAQVGEDDGELPWVCAYPLRRRLKFVAKATPKAGSLPLEPVLSAGNFLIGFRRKEERQHLRATLL